MSDLRNHPLVASVREIALARHIPLLLVGGAVRDWLLGKEAHDLDFAVQGNAKTLARAVADELGGAFYLMDAERNTARVFITRRGQPAFNLDFAVCRGASWEEDLFGRDFSINAIALDVQSGAMLDSAGGLADLTRRVVRQVTPHAVTDDPVRALRAVRIALALEYTLDPATAQAAREAAGSLDRPSPERVRDELLKALALPNAARAVRWFDELGLLQAMIPEVAPLRDCTQSPPHRYAVLEHTFVVLDYLDGLIADLRGQNTASLAITSTARAALLDQLDSLTTSERSRAAVFRLAVLLHDIAKPLKRSVGADGRIHFAGHEAAGAKMAAARATALRLSSTEVDQIRTTVQHHAEPNRIARDGGPALGSPAPGSLAPRDIHRFMCAAGDCAPEIALFCPADGYGKAGAESSPQDMQRRSDVAARVIEQYYACYSPAVAPRPLVSGDDVMALGVRQGPLIGRILNAVREAQMIGEITTRAQALALVQQLNAQAELPSSSED
ncbi:MAG TPA: HD domain-containing protein [Anaerolineae bacterium]